MKTFLTFEYGDHVPAQKLPRWWSLVEKQYGYREHRLVVGKLLVSYKHYMPEI